LYGKSRNGVYGRTILGSCSVGTAILMYGFNYSCLSSRFILHYLFNIYLTLIRIFGKKLHLYLIFCHSHVFSSGKTIYITTWNLNQHGLSSLFIEFIWYCFTLHGLIFILLIAKWYLSFLYNLFIMFFVSSFKIVSFTISMILLETLYQSFSHCHYCL